MSEERGSVFTPSSLNETLTVGESPVGQHEALPLAGRRVPLPIRGQSGRDIASAGPYTQQRRVEPCYDRSYYDGLAHTIETIAERQLNEAIPIPI